MAIPARLNPCRANAPASQKVSTSLPSSARIFSTMPVSTHSSRQSQLWACSSRPLADRSGITIRPVQPSVFSTTARSLPNIISVRQLIVTTSSIDTPAPSAMPSISSR